MTLKIERCDIMDKPTIEQIIIETKREAAWRERDRCLAIIQNAADEAQKDEHDHVIDDFANVIKARIEAGK